MKTFWRVYRRVRAVQFSRNGWRDGPDEAQRPASGEDWLSSSVATPRPISASDNSLYGLAVNVRLPAVPARIKCAMLMDGIGGQTRNDGVGN